MILCFLFQSFCLIFFEILQIRGEQRKGGQHENKKGEQRKGGQHENKKNIFSHAGDLYAAVTGVSQ